ncbi:MAG: hypothetical protein KDB07_05440, partial [Planctomycetes bacterium]|nr:hypothetical protein [Planctomycetota bacterium]
FGFVLAPLPTMGIGERYLPVRVVVKGRNVYEFVQRIRLDVVSALSVTETTAIDPGEGRGLEMIFKAATTRAQAQTLTATLSLPEHPKTRARVFDFALAANGSFDVPFSLPPVPRSKQEGLRVALSIREQAGNDFLNQVYVVTVDPETNALSLVPEESYVAP